MSVIFKDLEEVLREHNLRVPTFTALVADAHLYEVAAIQPSGSIAVREDFIGHENRDEARKKFAGFLDFAHEKHCDLVLTPEYSCPWDVLKQLFSTNNMPEVGKLWILGCESITPHELESLKKDFSTIQWIHEPIPNSSSKFLGVVAYIFKAEASSGGFRDVVLLQFKTQAMAHRSNFERDHLIEGKTVYILRNPNDVIRLVSLICAESLVIRPSAVAECRINVNPFIIFHPQLNPDPCHAEIRRYRSELFSQTYSERIEVFSLNWARGFAIPNEAPSNFGGSAVYTKSPQFLRQDSRLHSNHEKGLYYSRWHAQRTDLCVFNFDEHIFHFRLPKVHLDGAAVLLNRSGPEMLSVLQWNAHRGFWETSLRAEDGFKQLCDSYEETACDFCLDDRYSSVDRERLLTLSAGKLEPHKNWHDVIKLQSFIAEEDERLKRLTFVHDRRNPSVEFRKEHLGRFVKLQTRILPDVSHFPPNIHDLREDCQLCPPSHETNFRFNLASKSGTAQGATVLFLDIQPPADVRALRDKFVAAWGLDQTRRLVIWYEQQGRIKSEHTADPTITDESEDPRSISRTDTI